MSVSSSWRSAGEGVAIFASILIHWTQLAARTYPLCFLPVLSGRCAGQRARTAARVNG